MKELRRIVLKNSAHELINQLIGNKEIELLEIFSYPEGTAIWVLMNREKKLDKKITIKEPEKVRNQRKAIERTKLYSNHRSKIKMNKKINQLLNSGSKNDDFELEKELHRIVLNKKSQDLIIPLIENKIIEVLQEFNSYPEGKVFWILVNQKTLHENPFLKGIKEKEPRRKNRIAKEKLELLKKQPNQGPEEINNRFNIRGELKIKYLSKDNLGTLSFLEFNKNNKNLLGKITNKNGIEKSFVCKNLKFYGLDTFNIYKDKLISSNTQKVLYDVIDVGVFGEEIINVRVYSEFGISSEYNGKIGFRDSNNSWVIEPKFDICTLKERKNLGYYIFNSENIAKVRFEKKDGLINKDGQYLVPPIFDRILSLENIPQVPFSREVNFIYQESYVNVMNDGFFGIYDIRNKEVVVPVIFDKILDDFGNSQSFVCVMKDNFVGIYDIKKHQPVVIPPIFNKILTQEDFPEIPFSKGSNFKIGRAHV